jgi:hypothetical protein
MYTITSLASRVAGAALLASLAWTSSANAAAIVLDPTDTDIIPAVATFATTGALMSGMEVTLDFMDGSSETATWQTTGAASGAAVGTGWSVSLDGDSFSNDWQANFGDLIVLSMTLDGGPGLTLFDLTFNNTTGTDGSEAGLDFATSLTNDAAVTATYSRQVALSGDAPVGDLWSVLTVDFRELLDEQPFGEFTFVQDTDNDARRVIDTPEPANLALFGLALIGVAGMVRRRR